MNWRALLIAMSGPIGAGVRYAVTAAGTYAAAKWGVDGDTVSAVSAGAVAAASALLGILTATPGTKIAATAKLDKVDSVKLTSGQQVR